MRKDERGPARAVIGSARSRCSRLQLPSCPLFRGSVFRKAVTKLFFAAGCRLSIVSGSIVPLTVCDGARRALLALLPWTQARGKRAMFEARLSLPSFSEKRKRRRWCDLDGNCGAAVVVRTHRPTRPLSPKVKKKKKKMDRENLLRTSGCVHRTSLLPLYPGRPNKKCQRTG